MCDIDSDSSVEGQIPAEKQIGSIDSLEIKVSKNNIR